MKKSLFQLGYILITISFLIACNKKSDTPQPNQIVTTDTTKTKIITPLPSPVTENTVDLSKYTNTKNYTITLSKPNSFVTISETTINYNNPALNYNDTIYFALTNSNNVLNIKLVFNKTSSSSNTAPVAKMVASKQFENLIFKASDFATDTDSLKFTVLPTSQYGTFSFKSDSSKMIFTPSKTNIYYGNTSVTLSITDGKTAINTTYNGTIGTDQQIATYNVMSPYFNTPLSGLYGTSTLTSSSITTSAVQPSFFTANASPGIYYYQVLTGGTIIFTAGSIKTEYSVQNTGSALVLTNTQDASKIYTLRKS